MHAFVILFSALCSLYTPSFVESTKNPSGFKVELIHHDSPMSPFYNSSLTSLELITNAALRSISRSKRVSLFQNDELNKSPESIVIPNGGDYLMKIYIGTPPVERFAIADTGSDLIWVQCSPCEKCFPQDTPYFDPNKSSSFMGLSCHSKSCSLLPPDQHGCGNSNQCEYIYIYGDKSYTFGDLSTDSISFGEKDVTIPKSVFGCGLQNNIRLQSTNKNTGIVGLGAGPLSLVSQLGDSIGHKFSYCLVSFLSNTNSKLKFGNEATIMGNGVVSTPLIIKSPFYYLNLEGVTVGEKTVTTGQMNGNIIIDSGTTFTYLEQNFYNDVVASLTEVIGAEVVVEDPPSPFNFCFTSDDQMKFPDFVFHFTGADVTLKHENVVVALHNNLSCLFVKPAANQMQPIFGNRAQMDFLVEYDLEGKKVSFAPSNCSKN